MKYVFFSHESAVEANWAIARRGVPLLDDEGVWMIPAAESCVTTQRDLRLLMREVNLEDIGLLSRPMHLLTPGVEHRSHGKIMQTHVWSGMFPEHAFLRVHERVFVSSPLFTVLQLALAPRPSRLARSRAEEAAREDARIRRELGIHEAAATPEELLAWEGIARHVRAIKVLTDFCGTYRLPIRPGERALYDCAPLLVRKDLLGFMSQKPSVHGKERGIQACELAFDRSGSPMETVLALLLSLPVEMGGYGLPRPLLNGQVPIGPEDREVMSQDEVVADLCWPDARLAVEYDSWEHHGAQGARKLAHDRARANSLASLGWTVLTVDYTQARAEQGMALLARQIARVLGCGLQQPTDLQRIWRARLHAQLMPRDSRHA